MAAAPSAGQGRSARAGKTVTIDPAALFAELSSLPSGNAGNTGNVWTTTELMERLGVGLVTVKRALHAWAQAGKCKPAWKEITDLWGMRRKVKAWALSE